MPNAATMAGDSYARLLRKAAGTVVLVVGAGLLLMRFCV
jgi:hypothetical protein